jgi:hypothetical protein
MEIINIMAIPKKKNSADDFIDGAKATKADKKKPAKKKVAKAEKEVSFLLKMPESLRLRLKIKAAEKGKNMNALVCDLINKAV